MIDKLDNLIVIPCTIKFNGDLVTSLNWNHGISNSNGNKSHTVILDMLLTWVKVPHGFTLKQYTCVLILILFLSK